MNQLHDESNRKALLNHGTLSLEPPLGRTLFLSFLLLAAFLGISEMVTRTRIFKTHVIANEWGSRHDQFEVQLGRLETIAAIEGRVDCIVIGSSMVWHGFDPAAFGRAYQDESGRSLRCFNFGVDGMPAASAGVLASILVEDYRPKLLIFGTDPRDYAVPENDMDTAVLMDTAWVRYRRGDFSPKGWAFEHMHFLRYRKSLGHLLRLEKRYLFVRNPHALLKSNYGFGEDETVGPYVSSSPRDHTDLGPVRYYFNMLSDYQLLPENLGGLHDIVRHNLSGTEVIVVEMPFPDTYMDFFGKGEEDYRRFQTAVQTVAKAYDVPFLSTSTLELIPLDGWVDYSHLNTKGAEIFSRWLGARLGALTTSDVAQHPYPAPWVGSMGRK